TVATEKTYSYRVRVVGVGGKSTYCPEKCVTTPLAGATGVYLATPTDTRVTLLWEDASGFETGFEVSRGRGCPASTFQTLTVVAANVQTYVDDSVVPETIYSYRIRAVNASGVSEWTANQCIMT